jgi:large subunit ribosomal protein L22
MVGYSFFANNSEVAGKSRKACRDYLQKHKMSRAIGRDLDISPRHSVELARYLRGKKLGDAKDILEEIIELKRAVPYKNYTRVGHRRGKGFGPGRYPVKAARKFLKLLKDVEHTAEHDIEAVGNELLIKHLSASKSRIIQGRRPRAHGRATPHNKELVNVEIVVKRLE